MKKSITLIGATGIATGFLFSNIAAAASNQVNVTLKEWRFITDVTKVKAGDVIITAENRGREVHEIVIMKTDIGYAKLPMNPSGGVNEEQAGIALDEIEDLQPGTKQTKTFKLEPGKYVIFCNMVEMEDGQMEEHYRTGMRAPLLVE
jgi:plastocyanin